MKRFAVLLLLTGAVFALTQCELFNTTVQYSITAGAGTVTVLYNDEDGDGVQTTTTIPWAVSFDLSTTKLPFVAALRVTNNTGGSVDAYIKEDGVDAVTPITIPTGNSGELFAWIQ